MIIQVRKEGLAVVRPGVGVRVEVERKGWDCTLYSNSVLAPVKDVKRYKGL